MMWLILTAVLCSATADVLPLHGQVGGNVDDFPKRVPQIPSPEIVYKKPKDPLILPSFESTAHGTIKARAAVSPLPALVTQTYPLQQPLSVTYKPAVVTVDKVVLPLTPVVPFQSFGAKAVSPLHPPGYKPVSPFQANKNPVKPYQTYGDKPVVPFQLHVDKPAVAFQPHSDKPVVPFQPHSDKPVVPFQPHSDKPVVPFQPHGDKPVAPFQPHSEKPVVPFQPYGIKPVAPFHPHDKPVTPFNPPTILGSVPPHHASDDHDSKHSVDIPILKSTSELTDNGYNYNFESADGISIQQEGTLKNFKDSSAIVSQGTYQYTAPDGTPVVVSYVADENGFQPQSDVLPVAPPVPAYITRSLAYQQDHPELTSKYNTEKKPQL